MYVFYKSFMYYGGSSTNETRSIYTHKVTVWENPRQAFIYRMVERFGNKRCTYNKGSRKLYLWRLARKTVVRYDVDKHTNERTGVTYAYSENYVLGMITGIRPGDK